MYRPLHEGLTLQGNRHMDEELYVCKEGLRARDVFGLKPFLWHLYTATQTREVLVSHNSKILYI